MSDVKLKIGITQGDPNGVGPEIIIKSLSDNRITELFTPVVYASSRVLAHYKPQIEESEGFTYTTIDDARQIREKRINLIKTGEIEKIEPGVSTPEAGASAVAALKRAVADLKAGLIDAVVTAPINKENVQSDDFQFTGHTEFFAAELGGEPLMMLCSDLLRVGLVTIHLPVSEVSQNITKEKIVKRLTQLRQSLIQDFSIVEPRIAVLALNPHAGDGGLLGKEEQSIIKPAILEAVEKHKILAFGPFAADGLFASAAYKKYDAVLAMYHDQGLAPFKALTPQGVNFTASLGSVRTSPDHGVAYDIAGQNQADPASMREAIYLAIDIVQSRRTYKQISANPLRRFEREKGADVSAKDLPGEKE